MDNKNLQQAKRNKNDEFYTSYEDIEKEIEHYKEFLEDKVVYCNCDNPEKSNFWKYFVINFDHLKLKGLISTFYDNGKDTYKTELYRKGEKKLCRKTQLTEILEARFANESWKKKQM